MLTIEEKKLGIAIKFPDQILEFLRNNTDAPFAQLTKVDENFERVPAEGLLLIVPFREAESLLPGCRQTLTEHGYQVFYDGQGEDEDSVRIGIIKSDDPYDILRLHQTNGLNYNLDTEDIIATLQTWEEHASFTILFASFNSVELLFKDLPEDVEKFLEEEVRPFCFDFGTQVIMGEEDIVESFKSYKKLSLWWD